MGSMGCETSKQTSSGCLVRSAVEAWEEAYGTRGRILRTELRALCFARIELRLDGVDHTRGESDLVVEGVLPSALVSSDWEVDRGSEKALAVLARTGAGWLATRRDFPSGRRLDFGAPGFP